MHYIVALSYNDFLFNMTFFTFFKIKNYVGYTVVFKTGFNIRHIKGLNYA